MAKRRHGGGDSLLRQARLETRVRYGPEKRALAELLHEARSDLRTGLAAEAGAADGIKAAVTAAQPELTRHYAAAHGDLRQADAQLKGDLATLSASADPYKAVAAREAAAARTRLDDALARAQTELVQRKVGAEQGRAFGARNQLAQYQQTAEKIHRQKAALAAEEGTFTHATLGDLREAKRKADFEERKFQETQRSHIADEQNAAEGHAIQLRGQDLRHSDSVKARQGEKKKFRAGALSKHQKIVGDIQDAASIAARLKKAGSSSNAIVELMSLPRSKDNPYGGFGPYTTRAAVSLSFNGYIKPHLLRGLRSRGLLLHRTPASWKAPPRRPHGGVLHGAFPHVYGR